MANQFEENTILGDRVSCIFPSVSQTAEKQQETEPNLMHVINTNGVGMLNYRFSITNSFIIEQM